jgi:hypothetical protein
MAIEYIHFDEVGNTGKTKIWAVMSNSSGDRLGTIKWHGPWRCYVFVPEWNTIWNIGCLETVNGFIRAQVKLRAQSRELV